MEIAGAQGMQYELGIWDTSQVASVEGAAMLRTGAETGKITFTIPENRTKPYPREKIVIHFRGKAK